MRSRTFAFLAVVGLSLGLGSVASAETREEFLQSLNAAPVQASAPAPQVVWSLSGCVDNAPCTIATQCGTGKLMGACLNNHCVCP
jgi:hypothetical protein